MAAITIRPMESGEAPLVQRIGRRAFAGMESLIIPKPKNALVAERDGKITGAVLYKFMKIGTRKIGYIDYAFVAPEYHGQGIGSVLYRKAIDFLWEQGCDALTALVKDDNVGSWSLFIRNGFVRISLPELARQFGLAGALKQYFTTPFCLGAGMEYYVALREMPCPSGKGGSAKQILSFLLSNFLLFLVVFGSKAQHPASLSAAYLILLAGGIAAGFVGTRFSRRSWKFRHNNAGALTSAFIYLGGGIYPMVGNWYPGHYEKTKKFQRDMGITALSEWVFVLGITVLAFYSSSSHAVVRLLGQIGTFFLIYRMIPFYPFESFGGRRVYRWSKWIYTVMAACSLVVVIASFARK